MRNFSNFSAFLHFHQNRNMTFFLLSLFSLLVQQLSNSGAKSDQKHRIQPFLSSVVVKMANCVKVKMNEKVTRLRSSTLMVGNLQPWTNCVGKCLKTSNHDQKPTKTTSCTPFPLSMLENRKIQTSVT